MKRTTVTAILRRLLLPVAIATAAPIAHADNIGVTLKLMDFDLTQPQREVYADKHLGEQLINQAIALAWSQQRDNATNRVAQSLLGPNRLGSGMTARNLSVNLGDPGAPRLTVLDHVRGRLELIVPGNSVTLTTTHPLSQGPSMDPRIRINFDLAVVVEFQVINTPPFVRALVATAQPQGVRVEPLNTWADIGLTVDGLLSDLGGARSIGEKIASGMEQSQYSFLKDFNGFLAQNAGLVTLPTGYRFNGGLVKPAGVEIAAYRVIPAAAVNVVVTATWPKSLGELMPDCGPVGIGAQYQSGPHSLRGESPPIAEAKVIAVNPRNSSPDAFSCYAVVSVPKGAPLNVSWARPVHVSANGPNNRYLAATVNANPQGWSNPVVVNAQTYFKLALSRHIGATGAGVQLNAGQAARVNPVDTVINAAGQAARINPAGTAAAPATNVARQIQSTAPGAKVSLNPQPLPPGDPRTSVKPGAAVMQVAPGSNVSLNPQPLPPGDPRATAQPPASTVGAPASSLSR